MLLGPLDGTAALVASRLASSLLVGLLGWQGAPSASPSPRAGGGDVLVLHAPGPAAVLIRGGVFVMGSPAEEIALAREQCVREPRGEDCGNRELFPSLFADELEPHSVLLGDFWIDRTEVTIRDYRRCADVGSCRPLGSEGHGLAARADDQPVTLVTWDDASAFCRWQGGRLPTEAEWERAARGWAGRRYAWGETYNRSLLNHGRFAWDPHDQSDGFATIAPVGSYPAGATPEGVVDLLGNVEEWVADWYTPAYGPDLAVDPRGPETGDVRVVRGGSYQSAAAWLRAAARSYDIPSRARAWRGFRCARDHGARPAGPHGDGRAPRP
jgi:formylglycine-generating enzyme required for sulfatase activity